MFSKTQPRSLMFLFLLLSIVQQSLQALVPAPLYSEDLDSRPIVHTPVGCYRGLRAKDGNYSMFLGIPYARVDPNNVFGASIPHVFEGIFDASDDSSRCPQIEEFSDTITGTLDCLHVNIYVPNSTSIDNPLPVMIYTFGGKFLFGFAGRFLYGPRFIVRHDVIFITFNYRLGPYGFMCLNTPEVPGNQGLKDQVKALRWIKENIRWFGGDNSRITLGGNSAGAISVDLHEYYLQEQLYHRIILQSGSALAYELIQESDLEAPFKLAKQLNYTTNDLKYALDFLSRVEPHEVIAAKRDSGVFFGLCIEKKFDNVDNYITTYPGNMSKVRDADVLIGFNNDEGYVGIITVKDDIFESTDIESWLLNVIFEFGNEKQLSDEIERVVRYFYYGDDVQRTDNRRPSINLYADFTFYNPILTTVKQYLKSGIENIYFYMFSYSGERSFGKDKDNISCTEGGAAHGDELGYLFDISYMKERMQDEDMLIVDTMTELWTNFIKYGNPTPKLSKLIPLQWPRVTQEKLPYLDINTKLRVGSRPMHERMSFLDLLYKTIGHYQRWMVTGTGKQYMSLAEEDREGLILFLKKKLKAAEKQAK